MVRSHRRAVTFCSRAQSPSRGVAFVFVLIGLCRCVGPEATATSTSGDDAGPTFSANADNLSEGGGAAIIYVNPIETGDGAGPGAIEAASLDPDTAVGFLPPNPGDAPQASDGASADAAPAPPILAEEIDGGACDSATDPSQPSCAADPSVSVFVSSAAAPGGDGSTAHPFATIGQAVANLNGKSRLIVCDGTYSEQVQIAQPVDIYGGFGCASVWLWDGGKTEVVSPTSDFALLVTGLGYENGITIQDMAFTAPDASGQVVGTSSGKSSIAGIVSRSIVNFTRVTFSAGIGADGAPGVNGATPAYPTANENYAVTTPVAPAGASNIGASNECAYEDTATSTFDQSWGGMGGLPSLSVAGGNGGSSPPIPPAASAIGHDGLGQDASGLVGPDPGADGLPRSSPPAPMSYGSVAAGPPWWLPMSGSDGPPGTPGQGGGGAMAVSTPDLHIDGAGGGAGGCGGAGGKGGGGGGGSIGLILVNSPVHLSSCTFETSSGGRGGDGGFGQDGQAGGAGYQKSADVDLNSSAAGGNGAGGTGGGGGAAGISAAVVYAGDDNAPGFADSSSVFAGAGAGGRRSRGPGAGGLGGLGGGGGPGNEGYTGVAGYDGPAGGVFSVLGPPWN